MLCFLIQYVGGDFSDWENQSGQCLVSLYVTSFADCTMCFLNKFRICSEGSCLFSSDSLKKFRKSVTFSLNIEFPLVLRQSLSIFINFFRTLFFNFIGIVFSLPSR